MVGTANDANPNDRINATTSTDGRVTAEAGAHQTIVHQHVIGMDKPFFTALAIALSIFSTIYAFEAGRQAALDAYWLSRCEVFLEQLSNQGVKVPEDLRHHK